MNLKRIVTDFMGKTIPQKVIGRLDNSQEDFINYRGTKLIKISSGGAVIMEFPSGYQRFYTHDGSTIFMEFYQK
jgi:hypothetical protein